MSDSILEQLEAEFEAEFDARLVDAMLRKAGEDGELVIGFDDLLWLLKTIGTLDWAVQYGLNLPNRIATPYGVVPILRLP